MKPFKFRIPKTWLARSNWPQILSYRRATARTFILNLLYIWNAWHIHYRTLNILKKEKVVFLIHHTHIPEIHGQCISVQLLLFFQGIQECVLVLLRLWFGFAFEVMRAFSKQKRKLNREKSEKESFFAIHSLCIKNIIYHKHYFLRFFSVERFLSKDFELSWWI